MIRSNFDIIRPSMDGQQMTSPLVVIEVSDRLFNFLVLQRSPFELLALRSYPVESGPEKPAAEILAEILASDELLRSPNAEVLIVYAHPESSLVPDELYAAGIQKNITDLVYGTINRGIILEESVPSWKLHNIFRVPRDTNGLLRQHFPNARQMHAYSAWLRNTSGGEDAVHVNFYPDHFMAMVIKDGLLQIIQSFNYQTPEDVVYYLLALCQQAGLAPENSRLKLEGLIDEQSSLFAEIRKYFLEIQLAVPPPSVNTGELLSEYPDHYFTPLLNLALCV